MLPADQNSLLAAYSYCSGKTAELIFGYQVSIKNPNHVVQRCLDVYCRSTLIIYKNAQLRSRKSTEKEHVGKLIDIVNGVFSKDKSWVFNKLSQPLYKDLILMLDCNKAPCRSQPAWSELAMFVVKQTCVEGQEALYQGMTNALLYSAVQVLRVVEWQENDMGSTLEQLDKHVGTRVICLVY